MAGAAGACPSYPGYGLKCGDGFPARARIYVDMGRLRPLRPPAPESRVAEVAE
jgi:hypothetical protein